MYDHFNRQSVISDHIYFSFFDLLSVLNHTQYLCIGYIVTDSWKGGGNQYIQLVKLLYCKPGD